MMNLLKLDRLKREGWVLVLISLSLVASCIIISPRKPFWNDELYSWYLIADDSFLHMLKAFADKINNTPILYFALGWLWAKLFGASELSLRLFSSMGFCLSSIIVWATLRRTYGFWASTIGVSAVFCTSEIVLSQNAEARMYGLFLAVCSLGFWLYDTIIREEKISKYLLVANTIVHAAIIHAHLFGPFYSIGILLAFVSRDIYFREWSLNRTKIKLYLSFAIAWFSFVFYIPAFLVQADAGNPVSWIPKPLLQDLILFLNLADGSLLRPTILALVLLISGLQFLTLQQSSVSVNQFTQGNQEQQKSLLILSYVFLAIPVLVWVLSVWKRPIFYERYLIPSLLSWVILVAHITEKIISQSQLSRRSPFTLRALHSLFPLALVLILLLQPIVYARTYAKRYQEPYIPGYKDNVFGYEHLPVVLQSSHGFLPRKFYSPRKERYFFILDQESAQDEVSGIFGFQEYKHLDALNRNYPNLFEGHILTSEEFLDKYQEFLVIDFADYTRQCSYDVKGGLKGIGLDKILCPQWVEKRLISNPVYQVTKLGEVDNQAFLLVRNKS